MAAFFANGPTRLRPHYKNHKCVALARRQLAHGAIGITCATLGEVNLHRQMFGMRDGPVEEIFVVEG